MTTVRFLLAAMLMMLAASNVSCAARSRTQVIVELTADSSIMAGAAALEFIIRGSSGGWQSPLDGSAGTTMRRIEAPITWPATTVLAPVDGDATRGFSFTVRALNGSGGLLATTSIVSGYVEGATRYLPLRLEACCQTLTCTGDDVCRGCACVPLRVSPTDLSPIEAGIVDAGELVDARQLVDAGGTGRWCRS